MAELKTYVCYWHKMHVDKVFAPSPREAEHIILQKLNLRGGDKLLVIDEEQGGDKVPYPY